MPRTVGNPGPEVGLVPWITVQCTLPHSRQLKRGNKEDESGFYERQNGRARLEIVAHPHHGLPYGKIPRLLIAHLAVEYKRTGRRQIVLGRTYGEFLRKLGMTGESSSSKTGGRARVRDQAMRLFTSQITAWHSSAPFNAKSHRDDEPNYDAWKHLSIADSGRLWWNLRQPDTPALFESYVLLSESFAQSCERVIPVDMNVLREFRSPFAIDLYCWLTYRAGMAKGKEPIEISWYRLKQQFGHGYAREEDFRKAFRRSLKKVIDVYPVEVSTDRHGVMIKPRSPHIRRRPHSAAGPRTRCDLCGARSTELRHVAVFAKSEEHDESFAQLCGECEASHHANKAKHGQV